MLPLRANITAPAAGATIPATGQILFSSNAGAATFTCQFGTAASTPCTSPVSYGPLTPGQSFTVSVTATVGTDSNVATATYTVGSAPPPRLQVAITAPSSGSTIPPDGQISFSANNPAAKFTCVFGGAAAVPCTSPASYRSLTQGQSFTVAVLARVGDLSSETRAAYTVGPAVVPVKPPQVVITSRPASRLPSGTAQLAFTATSAATGFECALDGSHLAPCSSPAIYAGLAHGTHTFTVRALGSGGVPGPVASASWTVVALVPPARHHGGTSWLVWLILAVVLLVLLAVFTVSGRSLGRRRRRAAWQLEARSEPPKQPCQERSHYCQKTQVKLKPGRRRVAYLELRAQDGDRPELRQTLDGPIVDALNRALHDYRRDPQSTETRASLRPAAALLVGEIDSWLRGNSGHHEITTKAHLTAAEIEFEFTLYRCAKKDDGCQWEHEDEWKASVEDEAEEEVARLDHPRPPQSDLESAINQLAEFLPKVDEPASLELSAML